jgi:hypothetical protein
MNTLSGVMHMGHLHERRATSWQAGGKRRMNVSRCPRCPWTWLVRGPECCRVVATRGAGTFSVRGPGRC